MSEREFDHEVESYLDLFKKVQERVGCDDNVAMSFVHEIAEDRRVGAVPAGRTDNGGTEGEHDFVPPTAKQLSFLRSLGVRKLPAKLTKERASELIDEAQAAQE